MLFFLFFTGFAKAQDNLNIEVGILKHIDVLASPDMHGRGYVMEGQEAAARYILKKFKEYNLRPVSIDSVYVQLFDFPVNTFPRWMHLSINGDSLRPGSDYLIDPSSSSFSAEELNVRMIDLKKIKDTAEWHETVARMDTDHAYYFKNLDEFSEKTGIRKDRFVFELPMGVYLLPEDKKLTWSVSRETTPATVFHVMDMPRRFKTVKVKVKAVFNPAAKCANIVGQVQGEVKDTFIVFSAHYDHLGMMGQKTVFPGASDNASGTAMLLSLAEYFAANPQHYSMLFIAFAGEEAGLMGSEFYTWKPLIPLGNIKFLTNIDIMGDATKGVTVVNATKFPAEFGTLKHINEQGKFVPEIRSRGPAANSDHYHFSEAGVHSFFIYSNGGDGYYHDIFDVTKEVKLTNIGGVQKLLIDFVKEFK